MDRKKELKQQYMETKIEAGVYQIRNTANHKIFIGSTLNLKTFNGKRFELEQGTSMNKLLQEDWQKFGKDAFEFEVLEVLEKKRVVTLMRKKRLRNWKTNGCRSLSRLGDAVTIRRKRNECE